jgi:hypothetical protein
MMNKTNHGSFFLGKIGELTKRDEEEEKDFIFIYSTDLHKQDKRLRFIRMKRRKEDF